MLAMQGSEVVARVIIFPDDEDFNLYYLLPETPRLRFDGTNPIFKFIKYRNPIELANNRKGGGMAFFDIDLSIPEDKMGAIRTACQAQARKRNNLAADADVEVRFAAPFYRRGTVMVEVLAADGELVQRVNHAGSPSLIGSNVVAVSAQLSPEGATIFEGAMKDQGVGGIRVVYDLWFPARMPPITATGFWNASKFYSFTQTVDFDERMYFEDDFSEDISELFLNSESRDIQIETGLLDMGDASNKKMVEDLRASLTKDLDEAVKRNLIETVPPENRDFSKIREEDFENIRRSVTTNKISNVFVRYSERQAVDINRLPQANLPTVTALGINWDDVATTIDADDPFFRTLRLTIQPNVEFDKLPVFSVEVSVDYPPHTAKHGIATFSLSKADDLGKFEAFTEGGPQKYKYQYVVNYKGEARTFKSPWIESEQDHLTVNVDDVGLWQVRIFTGDINFDQVKQAQIELHYEDPANGVPALDRQFIIDKDHKEHLLQEIILAARSKPFKCRVKYFMADSREYQVDWRDHNAEQLYINDPFSGNKAIAIRSRGDFEESIDQIFVSLFYDDSDHDYRVAKENLTISKEKRFDDWTFPVIDERSGKVTYNTQVLFKDGTPDEEKKDQVLTGNLLVVGPQQLTLEIEIVPDLIDWETVKLAMIELRYVDEANGVSRNKSFKFNKGAASQTWSVPIRDASKKTYSWEGKFFMQAGGATKTTPPVDTDDDILVIELPA